ncbi:MAG TPA: diacylglycerol kinase family protein [Streptosporangiaceae bacterium]|nr:diacylglycerol kinase family protein [Streptosporangiaceae bacterium]
MSGSLSLIVNPAAARGRALRILPEVTAELDRLSARYEVTRSASLDHARELAAAAAAARRAVVAVGGDGMAGAVAGAVAETYAPFGIVPAGRGNDLARVLGIPVQPRAAAAVLAAGHTRQADLISVTAPGRPHMVVAGSVYMGIPSVAGEIANAARWLRGPAVYPVAALRALAAWRTVRFAVDGAGPAARFPGCALVVANTAYFGAGMKVAPPARFDDGVLDVIALHEVPKPAFVRVLLKIRDGSHLALPGVTVSKGRAVTVTMDRPVPVAADGETLPWAAPLPAGTPLRIAAMPSALTALVPG